MEEPNRGVIDDAGTTCRVFVSSTFSDLGAERRALQQHVFPRLSELCRSVGRRFEAVDLRWGVTNEAALDQATMKVCLSTLKRCQAVSPRPNFIVLLGNRYGWKPLPAQLPTALMAELRRVVATDSAKLDELANEAGCGALELVREWYPLCDDNASPPSWPLRPRKANTIEADATWWARNVETPLWKILAQAMALTDVCAPDRNTMLASATHQEVLAGLLERPSAEAHVYAYFREIQNLSEVQDSRLPSALPLLDRDGQGAPLPDSQRALADLKQIVGRRLGERVRRYQATWSPSGLSEDHIGSLPSDMADCLGLLNGHPRGLCQEIFCDLGRMIMDLGDSRPRATAAQAERAAHARQADDATEGYLSLPSHPTVRRGRVLALVGDAGSGKTVLAAQLMKAAQVAGHHVMFRFLGATLRSSSFPNLVSDMLDDLAMLTGKQPSVKSLGEQISDLKRELSEYAGPALVVVLDGLDQLGTDHNAHDLVWLPTSLPSNLSLVVTTRPGDVSASLERLLRPDDIVRLAGWDAETGLSLCDELLRSMGRRLTVSQRARLQDSLEQQTPLYARLAAEVATRWSSCDQVGPLANDIDGLLRERIAKLSQPSEHGPVLVKKTLGLVCAAREGLSDSELLDLLSSDPEAIEVARAFHPLEAQRLPDVMWARLYDDLLPLLREVRTGSGDLLTFRYPQLRRIVSNELVTKDEMRRIHQQLAQYFAGQPERVASDAGPDARPNRRWLAELPHHLAHAGRHDELRDLVTNPSFLASKLEGFGPYALLADCRLLDGLELLERAIRMSSPVLQRHPEELPSQLYGRLFRPRAIIGPSTMMEWMMKGTISPAIQDRVIEIGRCLGMKQEVHKRLMRGLADFDGSWFAPMTGSLHPPGRAMTAVMSSRLKPRAMIPSTDGRWLVVLGDTRSELWHLPTNAFVHSLPGHASAVVSSPSMLMVIPEEDGAVVINALNGSVVSRLAGARDPFAFTGDGRSLVTAVNPSGACHWDALAGARLACNAGARWKGIARVSPDTRWIASAEGSTLRLGELSNGAAARERAFQRAIEDFVFTPDSRRLVVALQNAMLQDAPIADGMVHVLDVDSMESRAFVGGRGPLAVTRDGSHAVIGYWKELSTNILTDHHGVRIASLEKAATPHEVRCHGGFTSALALTSDGAAVVSGGDDGSTHVVELVRGASYRVSRRPVEVAAVATVPNQPSFLTAGADGRIEVWGIDEALLAALPDRERHGMSVHSVAVSPNARLVASGGSTGQIILWDVAEAWPKGTVEAHKGRVLGLAFSSDGSKLASASDDGDLAVHGGGQTKRFSVRKGHRPGLGEMLGFGVLTHAPGGRNVLQGLGGRSEALNDFPRHLAFVDDNLLFLTRDRDLELWDTGRGVRVREWPAHRNDVTQMSSVHSSFEGDIHALAIAQGGQAVTSLQHVRFWHKDSIEPVLTLEHGDDFADALAPFPDGRYLATSGAFSHDILIWDLNARSVVRRLSGHGGRVVGLTCLPGGRLIVSASEDSTVRLWDIEENRIVMSLHDDAPLSCAVASRTGIVCAAGNQSGYTHLLCPSSPDVVSRVADESDFDAILELMLAQGAGMPPQALRRVLRDRLAETPGGAIVAQSAGAMIGLAILTPAPLDEAVSFIEPQPAGDAACLFFRVLVIDAFAGKRSPAVAASLVAQARTLARRLGLPALSAVTTSHGHEVYLQAGFVKRPTQSASVAAALARLGPGAGYYVSGMANGRCPPQELHPTLRQGTSPRRTVVLGKR